MAFNILIDHGSSRNIGDNAMLINVVNYIAKRTNSTFYILDKGISLSFETSDLEVRMVRDTWPLLKMPHWRIRKYNKQTKIYKYICTLLFWAILICRGLNLAISTLFYKKVKINFSINKEIRYWSEILNKMDAYWVVGGGNINDIWIEQAFWKMVFAWIFKLQDKPVVFSGQGIGPIDRLSSKLLVKFGIKQMSLLSLREKVSLDNLISLGIKRGESCVIGDDALTIPENTRGVDFVLPEKFIAINVRLSTYSFLEEELLDKYAQLIELLMEKYRQFKFIFIPIALNKGDSDIDSSQNIIGRLKKYRDRAAIFDKDVSWKNIKFIIRHASLSMGISYHFCLFSLSEGIPTIGLYANSYYKQKLEGLMKMYRSDNGVLDLRGEKTEDLFESIQKSYKNFDSSKILAANEKMKENWDQFMSLAVDTIYLKDYRRKCNEDSSCRNC